MLEELMACLDLPEVFAKSPCPVWEDAHIEQYLLAAHLNPEHEDASRGPVFMDRAAEFIAQKMPQKNFARVLDLGCGPGLYAQRLAAMGYRVDGVDISAAAVAYAERFAAENGMDICYHRQDYLQMEGFSGFSAALLLYCNYGFHPKEERKELLLRVLKALRPGGRLLLDVFSPVQLGLFKEEKVWRAFPKGGFWSAEPHLLLQANRRYPKRVSLEQAVVKTEAETRSFYLWHQYFGREELAAELHEAGFRVVEVFDDVTGTAYSGEAPTLALLCEKPEEARP